MLEWNVTFLQNVVQSQEHKKTYRTTIPYSLNLDCDNLCHLQFSAYIVAAIKLRFLCVWKYSVWLQTQKSDLMVSDLCWSVMEAVDGCVLHSIFIFRENCCGLSWQLGLFFLEWVLVFLRNQHLLLWVEFRESHV